MMPPAKGGEMEIKMKKTSTVKTLGKYLGEYKLPSLLTPLCMVGEVVCEMVIPVLMGFRRRLLRGKGFGRSGQKSPRGDERQYSDLFIFQY